MTTNQSLTDAFKHTYKTGLKGLPILPALANFGVLAFFVTFFTVAEILSRQPIINDEGQTTGYISASNRYISFFFSDIISGKHIITLFNHSITLSSPILVKCK